MKPLLAALCFAWLPPALQAEVVILSQGIVKVGCGSSEKSLPVTITKALPSELSAKMKSLRADLRAAGVTQDKMEAVFPGKSYAIAVIRKKYGQCEWETYMWRTAEKGGAEKAWEILEKAASREPHLVSYSVQTAVAVD